MKDSKYEIEYTGNLNSDTYNPSTTIKTKEIEAVCKAKAKQKFRKNYDQEILGCNRVEEQ